MEDYINIFLSFPSILLPEILNVNYYVPDKDDHSVVTKRRHQNKLSFAFRNLSETGGWGVTEAGIEVQDNKL